LETGNNPLKPYNKQSTLLNPAANPPLQTVAFASIPKAGISLLAKISLAMSGSPLLSYLSKIKDAKALGH